MQRFLILLALIFFSTSASAQQPTVDDRTAIEAVRTQFAAAIQSKDLPAMTALFYDGRIEWRGSLPPQTRVEVSRMAGAPQPIVDTTGAYQFLNDPQFAKIALREDFGPLSLYGDGQMALATFNYAFFANGQMQNWGLENWQMVKTPNGWRILSLFFTATLANVSPMPEAHLSNPPLAR